MPAPLAKIKSELQQQKKVHLITFFGELAKTEMSAEMSAEVEQNWPEGGLILERQDPQNWH